MSNQDQLYAMRHSLAHIMATAVQHLWPEAKFGVGPVVENGFYYDIDLGNTKISEEDFKKIEKEMHSVIAANQSFEKSMMPINEAISWAKAHNQPYKEELLNDLKRAGTTVAKDLDIAELGLPSDDTKVHEVSFYTNGDFCDLCRGPHLESTSKVGAFKLMRVAGAYWRGKENNPQMQRLYGVAFATKEELKQHLQMLEEAKKRDHRKLGKEMDLFTFSDLVGPGLPLWTPRGTVLRMQVDKLVQELRSEYGYQPVEIPHITKKDLYEKSGHWTKFSEELFKITTRDGHEFVMKPMNCPHHTQIYASQKRSYKDLPIRYSNTTMVYRDEQTGELGGLSRVRSITQDDAHVFCRASQIRDEANKIWDIIENFYAAYGMEVRPELSFMDPEEPDKYSGEQSKWDEAQATLQDLVNERVGEVAIGIGEAAFYGPKIDFKAKDAIGREHQVATIQLDFNQPEGFDLTCTNEQSENERVVMIHAAIAGSLERFLSVLIEHTAGKFPVWLAPEQLRIITVSGEDQTMLDYAKELASKANDLGIRVSVDDSAESVGKKIRSSVTDRVPYTIVVGEQEVSSGVLKPRIRDDLRVVEADTELPAENFLQSLANESKSRVLKSSM
ncbi:threonine--tRNA ligase [Candidatus Saccharibacteria bacterium]|nr:threonine--tRNA ligase [Candidatus Saccharibacteria bacterium]MCB9821255.1 threonine--tRNA ligase [Candidatus Nomurabacteria bacterium]